MLLCVSRSCLCVGHPENCLIIVIALTAVNGAIINDDNRGLSGDRNGCADPVALGDVISADAGR